MENDRDLRAGAASPFLPADTVMAMRGLVVRARCVADGVLAGLHRSRRQGESAEFAEHKVYAPGDEVRRIDWKAFGKLDRYYVKRMEEETSLGAFLVVDTSASMGYPERGRHSKYAYAATLAASLSYMLLRQSDAVGLFTFDEAAHYRVPVSARSRQIDEIVRTLEEKGVGGQTAAGRVFEALSERVRRRSLVVVLSDLLGVVEQAGGLGAVLAGLAALSARGADVAVLQVLDPDELELPFPGVVRFVDLEVERDLQIDAPAIRDAYREEIGRYLEEVARGARAAGITYQRVRTDEPPAQALARFVAARRGPVWS